MKKLDLGDMFLIFHEMSRYSKLGFLVELTEEALKGADLYYDSYQLFMFEARTIGLRKSHARFITDKNKKTELQLAFALTDIAEAYFQYPYITKGRLAAFLGYVYKGQLEYLYNLYYSVVSYLKKDRPDSGHSVLVEVAQKRTDIRIIDDRVHRAKPFL